MFHSIDRYLASARLLNRKEHSCSDSVLSVNLFAGQIFPRGNPHFPILIVKRMGKHFKVLMRRAQN